MKTLALALIRLFRILLGSGSANLQPNSWATTPAEERFNKGYSFRD